jgi:hypothetical protein
MKNAFVWSAVVAVLSLSAMALFAEDKAAKINTKEVMKVAMKEGLCKKVADGKGTKEDAQKLVELFTALAANEPPKGDAESWKMKTEVLLAAAKACAEGKEGSGAELGKAANCAACHKEHKPPQQ